MKFETDIQGMSFFPRLSAKPAGKILPLIFADFFNAFILLVFAGYVIQVWSPVFLSSA